MNTAEIQKELRDGALWMSWDNRRVRKERFAFWFFIVFWVIWAPVTVYVTRLWVLEHFPFGLSLWLIFGWLGTFLIPFSILQRSWSEWISVSPEAISFGSRGWLAGKPKSLPLREVKEITLGFCLSGDDRESMVTLNVYNVSSPWWSRRKMIGYWLAPELKEEVYLAIQEFVAANKLPLRLQRAA